MLIINKVFKITLPKTASNAVAFEFVTGLLHKIASEQKFIEYTLTSGNPQSYVLLT